jgi:hypothetical protein
MEAHMLNQMIIDWRWLYGGPWEIWVKNLDRIGAFVKEQKLKAIPIEDLPVHPHMIGEQAAATAKAAIRPRPFPGGMRCAHLHFRGGIYLLNEEQWKSFSGAMVRQYQERLATVGTIGFGELMDVAAGIENLGV